MLKFAQVYCIISPRGKDTSELFNMMKEIIGMKKFAALFTKVNNLLCKFANPFKVIIFIKTQIHYA